MLVQHLVGLCHLRHGPGAIEIIVPDLSSDADESRDGDALVRLNGNDGAVHAFKAYGARHESAPLDVGAVDQLCMELSGVTGVTHRAIVSGSGYGEAAFARAHELDTSLLVLRQLTKGAAENHTKVIPAGLNLNYLHMNLLYWCDAQLTFHAPAADKLLQYQYADAVFSGTGEPHKQHATWGNFLDATLYRSTGLLSQLEPAQTAMRAFTPEPLADTEYEVGPAWPHTHTLDVSADQVFLRAGEVFALTETITISGSLRWQRRREPFDYYVLQHAEREDLFADAAVADWGTSDGRMAALAFASGTNAEYRSSTIRLHERHQNAILRLRSRELRDT